MAYVIPPFGSREFTIDAADKICIATRGKAGLASKATGSDKVLDSANPVYDVFIDDEEYVSSAFSSGGAVLVQNMGPFNAYVELGTAPLSKDFRREAGVLGSTQALNANGNLTFAMMAAGAVSSTTAANVQADLATGAVLDGSSTWAIGEGLSWGVINTGGNTFTVTASTGHTLTGSGAVATTAAAQFRTVKTAADTFVTTRIG